MKIGTAIRIGRVGGRFVVPEAETTALVARMSTAPDAARRTQINTLVAALKTAGLWAKLDCFYVMAAHDAQAARLNWKSATFDLSLVLSPSFELDRGYTGNVGTVAYLDSGFNPVTAAGLFAQDSAHMGVWSRTDYNAINQDDVGNLTSRTISRSTTGVWTGRMNTAAAPTGIPTVADSLGHFVWARDNSATVRFHKNGPLIATGTGTSAALTSTAFRVCAANGSAVSSRQLAAAHWGSALTEAEVSALNTALLGYLTPIGAA